MSPLTRRPPPSPSNITSPFAASSQNLIMTSSPARLRICFPRLLASYRVLSHPFSQPVLEVTRNRRKKNALQNFHQHYLTPLFP
ncbi:hypothetical protein JMJ77_0014416 [Colletotrichum scovillei]|uniref:Uncharacterized protein n=1 Tax=Colletotrichum scovillei TaxID=1209932 RepID=A0A9P7R6R2_9PEZI|nr:hypothetical protein JMJ77_0014416 [Colletotrichum scovillei]KAG7065948.1 hypothetical protein JMJ78_0012690 [Colletotrichum scovillei]KAG7068549.1 hypothetical protein JMJ76_0008234 [Colletotrichum scovillei]